MNNQEAVITLSIKEAAQDKKNIFTFRIQLGKEVIAPDQSLSPEASMAARKLSKTYNALFEKRRSPRKTSDDLKMMGGQLFNTWLAGAWPAIAARLKPGMQRALVIASESPEILNLPWELISPEGNNFIGLDPKFTVRRLPKKNSMLADANDSLPPRPMRILFMACAPREAANLEFEREEEAIIKAIAKAGTNVAFDSGDAGTFEELLERINEFQPHIVHLTGHGIVKKDGLGYFAFEVESGLTDLRSSVEMREQLFGGSSVQLAFISGCQTGKAPPISAMGGICQGLVSEEVPMAIGWAASIADDIATQFAATFYKSLASGQPVDRALTQARQSVLKLLGHLVGQSRAIITCRYLPDGVKLPPNALQESLADFPESSFLKFMLRDAELERRYYAGELPRQLLIELHGLLGGTPRFLGQMREAIKTMTADELRDELQKVKLTAGAEASVLQRERDKYCEDIFTARLYGYLSPESQRALSRAAVYRVPVNIEGLCALTKASVDGVRGFLREWQNYALIYADSERGKGDLWSVYRLLRGWLLSQLKAKDRRSTHRAAGNFLREIFQQKRAGELGMNWIECLTEARAQFIDAKEYEQARVATDLISGFLIRQGLYKDLEKINRELLTYEEHPIPVIWIAHAYLQRGDYITARELYQQCLTVVGDNVSILSAQALHGLASVDLNVGDHNAARDKFQKSLAILQQTGDRFGEASTWHQLATIDVYLSNYDAARHKYQKSLEIKQAISNRADEAVTWHGLASIDLERGDYDAARDKFEKILASVQQSGDREGEAATFYQLGLVADISGRQTEGIRLVALSFLILQSIGHADVKHPSQALPQMATQLSYTQEQFDAMLQEAAEAYKIDRGLALVQAAFSSE